jgi:hypothetical protein
MNRDKASRDKANRDNETQDLEGSHFPNPSVIGSSFIETGLVISDHPRLKPISLMLA